MNCGELPDVDDEWHPENPQSNCIYMKDEADNIPEPGSDERDEKTGERNQEIAISASRGERCTHDCAI
jgi:hypothetical protein